MPLYTRNQSQYRKHKAELDVLYNDYNSTNFAGKTSFTMFLLRNVIIVLAAVFLPAAPILQQSSFALQAS